MDSRRPAPGFDGLTLEHLSYFGLVELRANPGDVLAGDRTLVRGGASLGAGILVLRPGDRIEWASATHKGRGSGNVSWADGSVRRSLTEITHSNAVPIRLAIP